MGCALLSLPGACPNLAAVAEGFRSPRPNHGKLDEEQDVQHADDAYLTLGLLSVPESGSEAMPPGTRSCASVFETGSVGAGRLAGLCRTKLLQSDRGEAARSWMVSCATGASQQIWQPENSVGRGGTKCRRLSGRQPPTHAGVKLRWNSCISIFLVLVPSLSAITICRVVLYECVM